MLKRIPRSGYHFLGCGKESVAEHSFIITFIAFLMSEIEPDLDSKKLITMCLVHDLPEARTGDMNYVQKEYVKVNERKAIEDLTREIPFDTSIADLIEEFNQGITRESLLARDADQIALILDLKSLADIGYTTPEKWMPHVTGRLKTETGKKIAESICHTPWDNWWMKLFSGRNID